MQRHFKLLVNQENAAVIRLPSNDNAIPVFQKIPSQLSNSDPSEPGAATLATKAAKSNWRVKYSELHSQACISIPNAQLKLDPFDAAGHPKELASYTPILRRYKAWQIKDVVMARPRLVCVLTTTGHLDIYNASNVEDVFTRSSDFNEVGAPPIDEDWPML